MNFMGPDRLTTHNSRDTSVKKLPRLKSDISEKKESDKIPNHSGRKRRTFFRRKDTGKFEPVRRKVNIQTGYLYIFKNKRSVSPRPLNRHIHPDGRDLNGKGLTGFYGFEGDAFGLYGHWV